MFPAVNSRRSVTVRLRRNDAAKNVKAPMVMMP